MIGSRYLRFIILLLAGAPVMARPAGRLRVECVDGTPCTRLVVAPPVVKSHKCCVPPPCDRHPAPVKDKRCILKLDAASVAYARLLKIDGLESTPLPLPIAATDITPPLPSPGTTTVPQQARPPSVEGRRTNAARAPPADLA